MQSSVPSQPLVHSAELFGAFIGVVALAFALELVVLSAKFGELPLSDRPTLALLSVAAVVLCVGHFARVGRSGHLPVAAVLVGTALACATAVYMPGSPVPQLVVLHKPWGAFAVTAVVVVLSAGLLRLWRPASEQVASLSLAVALAASGVALYVWLLGLIGAAVLFVRW